MTSAVTELNEPYVLPPTVRRDFDADGFVHLGGVLSAQTVAAFEPAITGKVIELNTMRLPMAERTTYQKAFLQIENLWRHDGQVREFVFAERLARIAAELLGVRGVRLYHDQALYKEVGGGRYPVARRPVLMAAGQRPVSHRVGAAAGDAIADGAGPRRTRPRCRGA